MAEAATPTCKGVDVGVIEKLKNDIAALKDDKSISEATRNDLAEKAARFLRDCIADMHEKWNKDVFVQPKEAVPPKPSRIRIVSAEYGDHTVAASCGYRKHSRLGSVRQSAPAANLIQIRHRLAGGAPPRYDHGAECSHVCDAKGWLETQCSDWGDPKDFVTMDSLGNRTTGPGLKRGTTDLAYIDMTRRCSFEVGTALCNNLDPSPDTPKKSVRITYLCDGYAESRFVEAWDHARVTLACPVNQPAAR